MDVYVYQAALLCEDCGRAVRDALTVLGKAPEPGTEERYVDPDAFPKGPYPNGGGEADLPQHCDRGPRCINAIELDGRKVSAFLENALTTDGLAWLRKVWERPKWPNPPRELHRMWAEYYGIVATE